MIIIDQEEKAIFYQGMEIYAPNAVLAIYGMALDRPDHSITFWDVLEIVEGINSDDFHSRSIAYQNSIRSRISRRMSRAREIMHIATGRRWLIRDTITGRIYLSEIDYINMLLEGTNYGLVYNGIDNSPNDSSNRLLTLQEKEIYSESPH